MAPPEGKREGEGWVRASPKEVVGTTKCNPFLPALLHRNLPADSLQERNIAISTQVLGAFDSQ